MGDNWEGGWQVLKGRSLKLEGPSGDGVLGEGQSAPFTLARWSGKAL